MADVKTDNISSTEFGKLFFEFKPRFIALAYRYVRDRETAEDLVSDSFMTFWEMHETLPDINVPAYILTSVKNRCLNHLNAQIRHRRAEQDMHSTLTRRLQADVRSLSACDPDLLFSEEIRAILKQAVRKMPKMTRSVFLLSRIRNMTYSEIAAELGISVSHVNFEIRRALNLMRFELKDYLPAVLITLILSSGGEIAPRRAVRSPFRSFFQKNLHFLLLTPSVCLLLLYNTNTWTIFYCRNT